MAATQSPGGGGLRQRVLSKELTWQVGGTAGRPVCLRRVSRGTGGSWSLSSGQGTGSGMEALDGSEQRSDVMLELRDSSNGHWRGDSRGS